MELESKQEEPKDNNGMSPHEKYFYSVNAIFAVLAGAGTILIVEARPWSGAFWLGVFYTVSGFWGLIVMAGDLLKQRVKVTVRKIPIRTPMALLAIVGAFVFAFQFIFTVFSVRADLDTYVMPRTIAKKQVEKLRDYLFKHPGGPTIYVRAVQNDREAMEYAGQLFNALRLSSWGASGISTLTLPNAHRPAPKLSEKDASGQQVYKDNAEYWKAYNAWLEMNINNKLDERNWSQDGLCIDVELAGQPTSEDPRIKTPAEILKDAMAYADVEVTCGGGAADRGKDTLIVMVGHRPRILGDNEPLLMRIGEWIQRAGSE
jgi:hypothetical protein